VFFERSEGCLVQLGVVNPDVAGYTVEPERRHKLRQVLDHHLAGQHRLAPSHRVEMQVGKPSRPDPLAKFVYRLARSFHRAVDLYEFGKVVDGKVRGPIDREIRRMTEIAVDDEIGDEAEHARRDQPRIKQLLAEGSPHGVDVDPIVVGPHEGKVQTADIARLEEALFQAALEERPVFVVIPIKDEVIDAVVGRGINFALHDTRIRLVLVSPDGNLRLFMSGKTRPGLLDQLPFGPTRSVHLLVARINVVIREIVTPDADV